MDHDLSLLEKCELCPRRCKVNRLKGERGFCGIADKVVIAHYGAHFGEEPPITGTQGSGNIFFASCNMRCIYCQNYQISHKNLGKEFSIEELVELFFSLEKQGLHNINLVSPSPYVPLIAAAIREAKEKGIGIPFVYNTNAYEHVDTIRGLDGLIDIYLPDFKYWNKHIAKKLSDAKDYPDYAKSSLLEMKRQVGDLFVEDGIAKKGMLIRHLVLPNNLAGSKQVLTWIKDNLGRETHISLMSQYYPLHKAYTYTLLNRKITEKEYDVLINRLIEDGFENVFIQELDSAPLYVPDFEMAEPFRKGYRGWKIGFNV
jgi:putative pyruvate formate lyase activating enzyme